jgi:uncharacterized protein (UPF0261 family)
VATPVTRAYVVGTLDTKGDELRYVRDVVRAAGLGTVLVDVSTAGHPSGAPAADVTAADVTAAEVAAHHPDGADAVWSADRGDAVAAMSTALVRYVRSRVDDIGGIVGAGGSGGTSLVAPAMRSLPIGVPKVLVSTVASADVSSYVGPADIAMMYSVTDVAGLNRISRRVLGNAANALAGMMRNPLPEPPSTSLPPIALTMFGVTTPLVTRLARTLSHRFEPIVFHATGTGGRSMEKLVDSGLVRGVLDMTTTEIADHVVGGVFSAGPDRLGAFARTGVPYVGSVGAVDMVNFGAVVPEQFRDRQLHVHNAEVTLMRTSPAENVAIGRFIAERLNRCRGPVRFLLPERGVSALDAAGQPFHDPDADAALFDAIEAGVLPGADRIVERVPAHINDEAFAARVLAHADAILGGDP